MKKRRNGKYSDTLSLGRVWLGKRRDSGVWYVRCPVPHRPTPIFQSLGTSQKKDAIREAELLNQQVMNRKYSVADGTIPLKLLLEKYLSAKTGRIKIKSFKRVQTTVTSFTGWLDNTYPDVKFAKHLTAEIIREFQTYRESTGLSLRTCNNDVKNLHSVFKWAIRENLIDRSPADYSKKSGTIDLFKLAATTIDVYTEQEYNALVAEAERKNLPLIRDLIVVYAGTGMRFEELANLRKKNIRWDTAIPTIEVRSQNGWTPKDPREIKHIPMLPEVQAVLHKRFDACQDAEDLLFTNSFGRKIHEGLTLNKLKELFPAVGINGTRRLHWHSLRNYFIIRCLRKGVAVPAIMKWTGHDSASMVLHYAEVIRDTDVYEEFRKVS
ncbi:MAG: site-specific integrase [bacterium]